MTARIRNSPSRQRAAEHTGREVWRIEPVTHDHRARVFGATLRPPTLQMTTKVYAAILTSVGSRRAESGGMLGGNRLSGIVNEYEFDVTATTTGATYSPNAEYLNRLLRDDWNPRGVNTLGFVHSHPRGYMQPSPGDIEYVRRFFEHLPALNAFHLPIVGTIPDSGQFELVPWVVVRHDSGLHVVPTTLELVDAERDRANIDPVESRHAKGRHRRRAVDSPDIADPFERVRSAYDVDLMQASRAVVFGAGGAAQWAEDMVRAGLGEIVLVDPDVIEARNVGTQQVVVDDVGMSKVEALARRLSMVNPSVRVVIVQATDDALDASTFERLSTSALPGRTEPRVSLVCGFTDSFHAQARIARHALRLGLPAMAAQVYAGGAGAEVTFAVPGRTSACQRCALGGRYRAFAADPDAGRLVGSQGAPIWATARLNALKGMIATAIIHASDPTPSGTPAAESWRAYFDGIGNRNLVLLRMWPDIEHRVGISKFDDVLRGADRERVYTDDTVWLPQDPENPATGFDPCGDCGGSGDLRAVARAAHLS